MRKRERERKTYIHIFHTIYIHKSDRLAATAAQRQRLWISWAKRLHVYISLFSHMVSVCMNDIREKFTHRTINITAVNAHSVPCAWLCVDVLSLSPFLSHSRALSLSLCSTSTHIIRTLLYLGARRFLIYNSLLCIFALVHANHVHVHTCSMMYDAHITTDCTVLHCVFACANVNFSLSTCSTNRLEMHATYLIYCSLSPNQLSLDIYAYAIICHSIETPSFCTKFFISFITYL